MGWLFGKNSRKDLIAERVEGWDIRLKWDEPNSPVIGSVKVLRWCTKGNNLWKLMETTKLHENGETETYRWIALDLLRCHPHDPRYKWGYKDLDETMQPLEVNCPLSYIEEAGDPAEWAAESSNKWREGVREYWAEQKKQHDLAKTIEVGDIIKLKPSWTPKYELYVSEIRKRGGSITIIASNFRISVKAIGEVIKRRPVAA